MQTWILIASSGDHKYLPETLESIFNTWKGELHVVVSYDGSITELNPSVIYVGRKEQLSQFEHYKLLSQELNIKDEDIVILCDDDDLFFPDAYETLSEFLGFSFVGEQVLAETEWIPEKINKDTYVHPERRVDDFSGTTTQGKYFIAYFKEPLRSEYPHLEDTYYMKYIESLPNCQKLPYPFIIHRLKEGPSTWLKEITPFLKSLI